MFAGLTELRAEAGTGRRERGDPAHLISKVPVWNGTLISVALAMRRRSKCTGPKRPLTSTTSVNISIYAVYRTQEPQFTLKGCHAGSTIRPFLAQQTLRNPQNQLHSPEQGGQAPKHAKPSQPWHERYRSGTDSCHAAACGGRNGWGGSTPDSCEKNTLQAKGCPPG